jgi:hypothetical protein
LKRANLILRLANTNKKDAGNGVMLFCRAFGEMDQALLFKSSNGLKGITLAFEENSCRSERNSVPLLLYVVIRRQNTFWVEQSGDESVWFGVESLYSFVNNKLLNRYL